MPPRFTHGLVRKVSRSLANCELQYLPRQTFDIELAARQHEAYVRTLEHAGVRVAVLPEEPNLPDATFVEDPIIILDEIAIACRPGVSSRAAETATLAEAASAVRPVHRISPPATLEGGDVLRLGETLFVGRSGRTNQEGIRQLEKIVRPFGYRVVTVQMNGCLHLKSAVTSPVEGLVIVNPAWIDLSPFRGLEILDVPADEPWAANTLSVNGIVLVAQSTPRTAELLESKGLSVQRLDISEFQKAEAALTCLSVLYSDGPP